MGNSIRNATDNLMKEYEISTGKLLLKAIAADSPEEIEKAISVARKELVNMRASVRVTHDEEFETMTKRMLKYLTQSYDIGEGLLFKKSPVNYAKSLNATEAVRYLEITIEKIISSDTTTDGRNTAISAPKTTAAVGKIDRQRVDLAKERLKELRNKK